MPRLPEPDDPKSDSVESPLSPERDFLDRSGGTLDDLVRTMTPRACLFVATVLWLATIAGAAGAVDHERWKIKTSIRPGSDVDHPHAVALSKLIVLKNAAGVTKADVGTYADLVIPGSTAGLHEGEIISTKGYIHVVMYSSEDDDYHVQISLTKVKSDKKCFVVEVPKDAAGFAQAGAVQDSARDVRTWLRRLTKNHEPSTNGSLMGGPPYVKVVGQLFFDASHAKGNPRGRRGQTAPSAWEIHPIMHLEFAPIPKPKTTPN